MVAGGWPAGVLCGLAPISYDFLPIPSAAFLLKSRVVLCGAAPGGVIHVIEYEHGKLGAVVAAPNATGKMRVRRVLWLSDPLVVPHLEPGAVADRSWGRSPKSEVVLTQLEIVVDVETVPTPVKQSVVVPNRAYHLFRSSIGNVLQTEMIYSTANGLDALRAPVTPARCAHLLMEYVELLGGGDSQHAAEIMRTEISAQITPETTRQKSLSDARAELRAVQYPFVHALMSNADGKMTWIGDRAHTLEYYFTDEDDLQRVLQLQQLGWVVPEKEPDRRGAERKRLRRHCGFMLPFGHDDVDGKGSNVMRYSFESKKLEIAIAVGFFDESLQWVCGADPPAKQAGLGPRAQYDIVTRAWRRRNAQPPLTLARADAHYAQSLVFS